MRFEQKRFLLSKECFRPSSEAFLLFALSTRGGYNFRPMASIDAEVVKHALQVARDHGFAEVELANGQAHFRATLEKVAKKKSAPSPAGSASSSAPGAPEFQSIRANHVGYFRAEDSQLVVGNRVTKGEVIGSIATLGLANELEASVTGEIVEVMVGEGDPVQFGQVLAKVKP